MIGKLTYDQMLLISNELKKQSETLELLIQNKNIPDLKDFIATVEGYSKYLETTVEINKDADLALQELKNKNK